MADGWTPQRRTKQAMAAMDTIRRQAVFPLPTARRPRATETIAQCAAIAERLNVVQWQVVREAIARYDGQTRRTAKR